MRVDPDLPTVTGDPNLLIRIFSNLIDNALTFREKDRPARVRISLEDRPSCHVIAVSDEGIGIPACYHEKIFEIFQRLHSQEEYPGTGIGLAAVRRSAELMGGKVEVDSEPGKGSVFSVSLPKADFVRADAAPPETVFVDKAPSR